MPSKEELEIVKKAVVYDLKYLIEKYPDKTYTVEELKRLMDAYVLGTDQ